MGKAEAWFPSSLNTNTSNLRTRVLPTRSDLSKQYPKMAGNRRILRNKASFPNSTVLKQENLEFPTL
eukprot:2202787-Rhodomonas_salina.2